MGRGIGANSNFQSQGPTVNIGEYIQAFTNPLFLTEQGLSTFLQLSAGNASNLGLPYASGAAAFLYGADLFNTVLLDQAIAQQSGTRGR
jgi:hypothetical protein